MQVTVEMPDQVARQFGQTPDAVGRHVMEDAAIEGYRAGRLTQRQVGAMLGLDYWQTEAFLNERAVKEWATCPTSTSHLDKRNHARKEERRKAHYYFSDCSHSLPTINPLPTSNQL
jgi:hypothetical protein